MMSTGEAIEKLFARRGWTGIEPRLLDWDEPNQTAQIVPVLFVMIPIQGKSPFYRFEFPFTLQSAADLIPSLIVRGIEQALIGIERDGLKFDMRKDAKSYNAETVRRRSRPRRPGCS